MAWTRPFKAAWGASLGVGVVRYPAGQMRLGALLDAERLAGAP